MSVVRAVLLAVFFFAGGYMAGRQSSGGHREQLAGRQLQAERECPLEAMLGLEPRMASAEIAKLAGGLQAEAGAFETLQQHPGSKTIIQDAFVKLHHLLFQHRPPLLPLHEWGARGPKNKNFSSFAVPGSWTHAAMALSLNRPTGHARPSVLPRLAHNGWIIGQARRTPPNASCLGWDNVEYIDDDVMPSCRERWVFRYAARSEDWRIDRKRRIITGDLAVAVQGAEAMFDVIVCNQVFEHVARPVLAIGLIARMLRAGGLLFWSAPFNERFHLIPGDFFRYTVLGGRTLLEDAGLRVEHTQRWGNSMITSGYLLGFGAGDFTPQYLEKHMWAEVGGTSVKWLDRKANFLYINTGLVARKP